MRKYPFSTTLAAALLCGFSAATAQPLRTHLHQALAATPQATFWDMEAAIADWAKTHRHELHQMRGWKQIARLAWMAAPRVDPSGQAPDLSPLVQAAGELEKWKAKPGAQRGGWTPLGPGNADYANLLPYALRLGRVNCMAFHPTDTLTFWVGTSNGGLWRTGNGGANWEPTSDGLPLLRISDIAVHPTQPETLYVATGDFAYADYVGLNLTAPIVGAGMYKSVDGGSTWQATAQPMPLSQPDSLLYSHILLHPQHPDTLLLTGATGVWRSLDCGATWARTLSRMTRDADQHPSRPGTVFVTTGHHPYWNAGVSANGQAEILRSDDFGATWQVLNSTIPPTDSVIRIEMTISPQDTSRLYAVAANLEGGMYGVYRSEDAGQTWAMTFSRSQRNLLGWRSGQGRDTTGQGGYDLCIATDPRDRDKVYVGGVNAWASANGGLDFGPVSWWIYAFGKSLHADQHGAYFQPGTHRFFALHDGGIDYTDSLRIGLADSMALGLAVYDTLFDNADTLRAGNLYASFPYQLPTVWTDIAEGLNHTEFYRLGVGPEAAAPSVLAGSQDNGTYWLDDQGQWHGVFGGDGMEAIISRSDPRQAYVTLYYGGLQRTDDGFQKTALHLTDSITEAVGEGALWVAPFKQHPDSARHIYAGFENIWHSKNAGRTWGRISSLGSTRRVHDIELFRDSAHIILETDRAAGSSQSTLRRTINHGGNWSVATSGLPAGAVITDIEWGPNSQTAWVCYGGYSGKKVYKTTNRGQNWVNVTGNLPAIPINTLAYQLGSAHHVLYAGTDIGVYYTSDTTQGWKPYSTSLPNVVVTELELHHPSQKLYAATYGRGLWVADALPALPATQAQPNLYAATLAVAPNPTSGILHIDVEGLPALQAPLRVALVDVLGRVVHAQPMPHHQGRARLSLDLNLSPGCYYLCIHAGHQSLTERVLVR